VRKAALQEHKENKGHELTNSATMLMNI